jgi:hypothetical protein
MSIALMMEAVCTSKLSVSLFQVTPRSTPEDRQPSSEYHTVAEESKV